MAQAIDQGLIPNDFLVHFTFYLLLAHNYSIYIHVHNKTYPGLLSVIKIQPKRLRKL